MATITNKDELKKAIFEELGVEFHNIEITETQWNNIYDKAIKKLYENDMGATTDRAVALSLVNDFDKANMIFVKKSDFEALKNEVEALKQLVDKNYKNTKSMIEDSNLNTNKNFVSLSVFKELETKLLNLIEQNK